MDNLRILYGNFIIIYVDFKPLDPDPDPGGKNNADPDPLHRTYAHNFFSVFAKTLQIVGNIPESCANTD